MMFASAKRRLPCLEDHLELLNVRRGPQKRETELVSKV